MKDYSEQSNPKLAQYVNEVFKPEDEVLREIRERSTRDGLPEIQVGSTDGLHLEILARASGALKAVEIGTLGGYSAVCLLRGMKPGGKLHTFEFSPDHAKTARESFKRAGFDEQVRVHVGPALENLPKIENEGPFDLVFVDADKVSYPGYLEWAERNLRVGGLLIGDNTFAWGLVVADQFENDEDRQTALAIRAFNERAANGGRFRATLLPTGEGLTVAVKIG